MSVFIFQVSFFTCRCNNQNFLVYKVDSAFRHLISLLNFLQTDHTGFHWILTKLGVLVFYSFKEKWKQGIFSTYFDIIRK